MPGKCVTQVGDFVYLRTGEKCRVLHQCEESLFVSVQIIQEYVCGDEERVYEADGSILELPLDSFYDHPPTRVLSEEVVALEERSAELRDEIARLGRDARKVRETYENRLEKYGGLSGALIKLDQFLCGGITHYFVLEYSCPKILAVEETFGAKHDRASRGRLLTLSPGKGKTLAWSLNQYSDGSGSGYYCTPCTSLKEALAMGQEWIDGQVAEGKYWVKVVEFAQEHDLLLPEGYISALIEKEKRELEKEERRASVARGGKRSEKRAYWKKLREGSDD